MKPDVGHHEGVSAPETVQQLRRGATRVLFATSLLFAPLPFSVLFIVGPVPLVCTTAFFVRMIAVATGGETGGDALLVPAILAAHLVVGGGILYLIANVTCRVIFRLFPARVATFAVGLLLSGQVVASFFPVYVIAGEHHTRFLPLWRVWEQLVIGGR